MNKLSIAIWSVVLLLGIVVISKSCTTVDASHEGIKVSKIGSDRGHPILKM
ncbi:hypothetical protein GO730_06125 [Spirosoma sp. HMF3257]|uniref:hypothetical protein n=1 Tax=Spirosoma telluris TaxID=2183553 RepID=UPI0012F979D9|nr:hypothetical protein [Spirosoma telluris]